MSYLPPQGISIPEQECYLLNDGNAILDCLHQLQSADGEITRWIIGVLSFSITIFMVVMCRPSR